MTVRRVYRETRGLIDGVRAAARLVAVPPSSFVHHPRADFVGTASYRSKRQGAEVKEDAVTFYVDGSWSGWDGDTILQLTDGSVWRQDEYHYEYHYAYRPEVTINNGQMLVRGMNRAVRVRRLS